MQYGKLVSEGFSDGSKFDVFEIPRDFMFTIITEEGDDITDKKGQAGKVAKNWANGLIVEAVPWTQEHTDAINNAVDAFNQKHPQTPIPENEAMMW